MEIVPTNAILLIENNLVNIDKIIKKYISSIVNNKKYDKQIENYTYSDLIYIDCSKNQLKKEDVQNIIKTFSNTGSYDINKKFYIIKNIENSNIQSLNSLLKFLEEPFESVYAILTTNNLNKVLPTIVSRTQKYIINEVDEELFSTLKNKFNITNEQEKYIRLIYHDISSLIYDLENNIFYSAYFWVNDLLSNNKFGECLVSFKTKEYYEIKIILQILFIKTKKSYLLELIELVNKNINFNKLIIYNTIFDNIISI